MSYTKYLEEAYKYACNIIYSAEEILPETYAKDIEKFSSINRLVQEQYDNSDARIEIVKDFKIDVKRFPLPIIINTQCSVCATNCNINMMNNVLNFPTTDKHEEISVYCSNCDDFFPFTVVLRLQMEY